MKLLKIIFTLLLVAVLIQKGSEKTTFNYSDLSLFKETLVSLENGEDSLTAFSNYIESSSSGLKGWSERYRVSPELFKIRYSNNEAIFSSLPELEGPLRGLESEIENQLDVLRDLTKTDLEIPVYYFVSNQHFLAGTPVFADNKISVGIAVGIDPEADSDFDLTYTANQLSYVVVHEAVHIFQLNAQGGIENYRSIYTSEKGSMAAVALREGCAEYVTYLATGKRFGNRHIYVEENEMELWKAFKKIADEPPFSVPGWFSGTSKSNPDWPFQIGYSLGFNMCEAYHLSNKDQKDLVPELVGLYNKNDIQKVFYAYENYLDIKTD